VTSNVRGYSQQTQHMCIGDTFAISYNERAIFPWAQQQLLRAKPAYAWKVPRKWHQRKAGMELCHFLLALYRLLRGKAILASVPQTANTSKLTQHHRSTSSNKFLKYYEFHDHVTKRTEGAESGGENEDFWEIFVSRVHFVGRLGWRRVPFLLRSCRAAERAEGMSLM